MNMNKMLAAFLGAVLLLATACNQPQSNNNDYTKFRQEDPKTILVVPVINKSVDVTAPDYFLSTITKPLAERGYYVYPVYMIKRLLEDDGLSDADMVHKADPRRLGELFGTDAILYICIEKWTAKYAVLSTTVEVEFLYTLKSGKSGETLWTSKEYFQYTPQNQNSGNPLANLIAAAISAAVTKAAPNYIPMAQAANNAGISRPHHGLPAGPYHAAYKHDSAEF
jgi:hypothetical protein